MAIYRYIVVVRNDRVAFWERLDGRFQRRSLQGDVHPLAADFWKKVRENVDLRNDDQVDVVCCTHAGSEVQALPSWVRQHSVACSDTTWSRLIIQDFFVKVYPHESIFMCDDEGTVVCRHEGAEDVQHFVVQTSFDGKGMRSGRADTAANDEYGAVLFRAMQQDDKRKGRVIEGKTVQQ